MLCVFRFSDGNNWREGLYGWMIDRSCGPPHTPDNPCQRTTPSVDVGIRPSNDTMYLSPAFAKTESGNGSSYYAYGARDIEWYKSQFPVAAKSCPSLVILGAFNDYTEMNCWWPSECTGCETGEENNPYLFWNTTVLGIHQIQQACS